MTFEWSTLSLCLDVGHRDSVTGVSASALSFSISMTGSSSIASSASDDHLDPFSRYGYYLPLGISTGALGGHPSFSRPTSSYLDGSRNMTLPSQPFLVYPFIASSTGPRLLACLSTCLPSHGSRPYSGLNAFEPSFSRRFYRRLTGGLHGTLLLVNLSGGVEV